MATVFATPTEMRTEHSEITLTVWQKGMALSTIVTDHFCLPVFKQDAHRDPYIDSVILRALADRLNEAARVEELTHEGMSNAS